MGVFMTELPHYDQGCDWRFVITNLGDIIITGGRINHKSISNCYQINLQTKNW